MIDSVLKGTGNSRFLKSAVPAGTSWADALAMLQAGTFPIDFNGINTEGFQQVGTPLNKANLLKDATAAQIGLPPSTTPDGMFQALGNTGELHVWRKTVTQDDAVDASYTVDDVTVDRRYTGDQTLPNPALICWGKSGVAITVANSFTLNPTTNVITLSSPVNYLYGNDAFPSVNALLGKYVYLKYPSNYGPANLNQSLLYYIPNDASITIANNWRYCDKLQYVNVTPYTPAGTTTTYPVSTNPNAYQEVDDAKAAGYVLGDKTETWAISSSASTATARATLSDSISVGDDGTVSLANPSTNTPVANETNSQYVSVATDALRGKFLQRSDGTIWYIPTGANVSSTTSGVSEYGAPYNYCFTAEMQPVTGYAAIPAGTTIEYLGKLGDKARAQVVSYVGTGTYGKDNPCSISVDFSMKAILFIAKTYAHSSGERLAPSFASTNYADDTRSVPVNRVPTVYTNYFGLGDTSQAALYGRRSEDCKSYYWYNESSPDYQGNTANSIYYFLVIG